MALRLLITLVFLSAFPGNAQTQQHRETCDTPEDRNCKSTSQHAESPELPTGEKNAMVKPSQARDKEQSQARDKPSAARDKAESRARDKGPS